MYLNGWIKQTIMPQLPIFVNLDGRSVILLGEGDSADAKRRLIERAGGVCVGEESQVARLAFVAIEDAGEAQAAAKRLKDRGLLTNVVDRPALCDFTTPAIIDRSPMLIAIGTGGASAGLAKAVRQQLERILPQQLGSLAKALFAGRSALQARLPDPADRRRALDAALDEGGALDPMASQSSANVGEWISGTATIVSDRVETLSLANNDPDDLTLRHARLLGQADTIFHDGDVTKAILDRARADAVRIAAPLPDTPPAGLTLFLKLQKVGGE
jgi:uroporphyrin-III C-methyltransferase / precorrin-2 dehydrogenase / sirohydrochlorin ferrochelatase